MLPSTSNGNIVFTPEPNSSGPATFEVMEIGASAPTVVTIDIAPVNDPWTGGVTVAGEPSEGQVLSADTGALADDDGLGTFSYQWQRSNEGVWIDVGVNQATYALGQADIGEAIRVVVSYTDVGGTPSRSRARQWGRSAASTPRRRRCR